MRKGAVLRLATWTAVCDHPGCDEMGGCDVSERELVITLKATGWRVSPSKDMCPLHSPRTEFQTMYRVNAVEQILQESDRPMRPKEVHQELHARGRIDEYKVVTSTLAFLRDYRGTATKAGPGLWVYNKKEES